MRQNRATIKAWFETNDTPTQAQFWDVWDSLVNFEDDEAFLGLQPFRLRLYRQGEACLYNGVIYTAKVEFTPTAWADADWSAGSTVVEMTGNFLGEVTGFFDNTNLLPPSVVGEIWVALQTAEGWEAGYMYEADGTDFTEIVPETGDIIRVTRGYYQYGAGTIASAWGSMSTAVAVQVLSNGKPIRGVQQIDASSTSDEITLTSISPGFIEVVNASNPVSIFLPVVVNASYSGILPLDEVVEGWEVTVINSIGAFQDIYFNANGDIIPGLVLRPGQSLKITAVNSGTPSSTYGFTFGVVMDPRYTHGLTISPESGVVYVGDEITDNREYQLGTEINPFTKLQWAMDYLSDSGVGAYTGTIKVIGKEITDLDATGPIVLDNVNLHGNGGGTAIGNDIEITAAEGNQILVKDISFLEVLTIGMSGGTDIVFENCTFRAIAFAEVSTVSPYKATFNNCIFDGIDTASGEYLISAVGTPAWLNFNNCRIHDNGLYFGLLDYQPSEGATLIIRGCNFYSLCDSGFTTLINISPFGSLEVYDSRLDTYTDANTVISADSDVWEVHTRIYNPDFRGKLELATRLIEIFGTLPTSPTNSFSIIHNSGSQNNVRWPDDTIYIDYSPTVSDNYTADGSTGRPVFRGTKWVDTSTHESFICRSNIGDAIWAQLIDSEHVTDYEHQGIGARYYPLEVDLPDNYRLPFTVALPNPFVNDKTLLVTARNASEAKALTADLPGRLITWMVSGVETWGFIKSATDNGATLITIVIYSNTALVDGSTHTDFRISYPSYRVQSFTIFIPGSLPADSEDVGFEFVVQPQPIKLGPIDCALKVAASGSGAACTFNVYKDGTAQKSSAIDLSTNNSLSLVRLTETSSIALLSRVTLRVISAAGGTTEPQGLTAIVYYIPTSWSL